MHFILLFVSLSHAAKLPFCVQGIADIPLQTHGRPMLPSGQQLERALRPGLARFHQDVCRCLPRRRHQPPSVRAVLHVDPNEGETTVKYSIPLPRNRAMNRMVACLGEPTVTSEAFRYVSDMIRDGERIGQIIRYPLLLDLEDDRERPARSKPKK